MTHNAIMRCDRNVKMSILIFCVITLFFFTSETTLAAEWCFKKIDGSIECHSTEGWCNQQRSSINKDLLDPATTNSCVLKTALPGQTSQTQNNAPSGQTSQNPSNTSSGNNAVSGYVPLVGIPGVPDTNNIDLAGYLNALFLLTISLGALFAVIKIAIAGVKWSVSDIVTEKNDAKKDIRGALLGLGILLASVVALNTINPDLRNLNVLGNAQFNVYLDKDQNPPASSQTQASNPPPDPQQWYYQLTLANGSTVANGPFKDANACIQHATDLQKQYPGSTMSGGLCSSSNTYGGGAVQSGFGQSPPTNQGNSSTNQQGWYYQVTLQNGSTVVGGPFSDASACTQAHSAVRARSDYDRTTGLCSNKTTYSN